MTFEEKIAALTADIVAMERAQASLKDIAERNNEEGQGLSMVLAAEVLLREAVMHYEEEIATLKGPEAA